jgi:hypothetical protein
MSQPQPRLGCITFAAGLAFALALALMAAVPARAELGGDYDSIVRDQQVMNATLTTQQNPAYTTYILDMPDGTQVREYYSVHAGVFAIDWSGYGRRPNMRQVLGPYFGRFGRPDNAPHAPKNAMLRRTEPDFVLESRCIMRHFTGRAYIPQAVPQEVSIADVR